MKIEPTDGLTKLVKNELMGGLAVTWSNRCSWTVMGSECGGCNLAQVTPSTELQECAIRKWEELMTWVASMMASMVASMASMLAWWLRWRRWWPGGVDGVDGGGFDGFDGVDGGLDGGGVDGAEWWRRMVVDWGLRHRGH